LMHGRPMRPLYAKGLLPKTNEKFFRGTWQSMLFNSDSYMRHVFPIAWQPFEKLFSPVFFHRQILQENLAKENYKTQ
jgi:hypothetical protein